MKQFLFLILATFSLSAWSQQGMDNRIYQKADSVQRLIRERTYQLSSAEKASVLEQLRALEITLLGQGSGDYPHPNPPPYPGQRISVRGTIESYSFSFDVADSLELYQNCTAFVRQQRVIQADDVMVSVNFQPQRAEHNGTGWWTGAGQICLKIGELASLQGVRLARYGYIFAGSVENNEFLFIADNLPAIDQQCTDFIQRNRIIQADDIQVTRDFVRTQILHNGTAYWNGAYEICQHIFQGSR